MIYNNIIDLIGDTPMLSLKDYTGLNIYAKAEFLNPGGSIKDRVGKNMIIEAEKKGKLKPGMTIIEPTSGNTGIGLALVGVRRGYRVIIVMPENMSEERIKLLKMYGAQIVLTDKTKGMAGAIEKANELAKENPGSFIPSQFDNPVNPLTHQKTTGPEIWQDLDGNVDAYVACIGTGGTLSGTGRFLKQQNPKIKIVGVEYAKPVVIKSGVWLASGVTVCGGVTIGENSVIGAGSVVTRDIPANVFAAGNPCRVIRNITEKDSVYKK